MSKISKYTKLVAMLASLMSTAFFLYRHRQQIKEAISRLHYILKATLSELESHMSVDSEELEFETEKKTKVVGPKQNKSNSKPVTNPSRAKSPSFELSARQEEIYQLIRSDKRVTISDVEDVVPNVSNRTLRRDLNKLEKLGLIKQMGKTRDSYYTLKD